MIFIALGLKIFIKHESSKYKRSTCVLDLILLFETIQRLKC